MDETQNISPDTLIDWLCWRFATVGERFYPPKETARECVSARNEDYKTEFGEELEREIGQHGRAWNESVDFFNSLQNEGYDPVARAERHIQESALDLPKIEWEWLRDSRADSPEPLEVQP